MIKNTTPNLKERKVVHRHMSWYCRGIRICVRHVHFCVISRCFSTPLHPPSSCSVSYIAMSGLRLTLRYNWETLRRNPFGEIAGSLGDLGTLLPIMTALTASGAISLTSTLLFSGLANILSGAFFGIPIVVCGIHLLFWNIACAQIPLLQVLSIAGPTYERYSIHFPCTFFVAEGNHGCWYRCGLCCPPPLCHEIASQNIWHYPYSNYQRDPSRCGPFSLPKRRNHAIKT